MSFVIVALYHFFDFPHFASTRSEILAEFTRLGIKGTLLISPEGINGTLAGTREAVDTCLAYLKAHVVLGHFDHKESLCNEQPFARTKVRLKREVISLGEPVNPRRAKGKYVRGHAWNRIISDPDTVVIDARNSYEVHLGTFPGAIDPGTRTFKELPGFVREHLDPSRHKKVATFCTGGIRCEKFSSWLIEQGFEQVYQLQGGILQYLEDVPAQESQWQGECYVFDERVAVGPGLIPSTTATFCQACGHSLTPEDRQDPRYREDETCPYCS